MNIGNICFLNFWKQINDKTEHSDAGGSRSDTEHTDSSDSEDGDIVEHTRIRRQLRAHPYSVYSIPSSPAQVTPLQAVATERASGRSDSTADQLEPLEPSTRRLRQARRSQALAKETHEGVSPGQVDALRSRQSPPLPSSQGSEPRAVSREITARRAALASRALTQPQSAVMSLAQPRETRAMRAQSQWVQQAVNQTEKGLEEGQMLGSKRTATRHSERVQKKRCL